MITAICLAAALPRTHLTAAEQGDEGAASAVQGRDSVIARLLELGVHMSPQQAGSVALGLGRDGAPIAHGTDEAFALVARLPEIEQVTVYRPAGMTGQGLRSLSALPNLRVLALDGQNLRPADFAALADFKSLEALRLSRYGVSDEVLAHLATLPKLKRLEIGEPVGPGVAPHRVTAQAVTRFLEKAPPLQMLVAMGMPINDAGMAQLKRSTDMEKFWTDSPLITAAGWQNIAGMTKLRDLYARSTRFDDDAMLLLANMPELSNLMLDGTPITDAGMPALAGLAAMTDLGVKDTRVTDAGMVHLSAMHNLRNLYVGGTAVTTAGLAFVPRKDRMTMMRIGQRPLTSKEYRAVREMFPRSEIFDPAGFWSPERIRRAAENDGFTDSNALATQPPPAASRTTPGPLVFVFTGESNSGGVGPNASAEPAELAPRACVQIMNLTSKEFPFEDLRIGVNNLRDHAQLEGYYDRSHGWELELANVASNGAFAGHERVYLIKTGQGGSRIAEWAEDGPFWRKFVQRTEAGRKQLPADARWIVWLSLGINDALAHTPIATWKTLVVAHLGRIRKQLPGATIVMTQFQSMGYPEINQAIAEIAETEPDVLAVDSTDARLLDANHWDYDGLKTVTRRLIDATHQALARSTTATTTRTTSTATP